MDKLGIKESSYRYSKSRHVMEPVIKLKSHLLLFPLTVSQQMKPQFQPTNSQEITYSQEMFKTDYHQL